MGERIKSAVMPYFRRKEFLWELSVMAYALAVSGVWPPMASAAVCAAWLSGLSPYWALCGAVAGGVIAGELEGAIAAALFAAFGLFVSLWKPLKTADKLICLAAAQFVLLPLYHMKTPADCLTGLAGIAAGVFAAILMRRAVQAIRLIRAGRLVPDVDQLCLAASSALFIAAISGASPLGIRIAAVIAAAASVICVRIKGAGAVAFAVLAGAACTLHGGAGMELAGCLAACTLVCALAQGERWWTEGLFLVCGALAALWAKGALTHIECGIACAVCIAAPERMIASARVCVLPEQHIKCERELDSLRAKTEDVARVLTSLSELQIGSFASRQLAGAGGALKRIIKEGAPPRRRFKLRCGAAARSKNGGADTGDCMGVRSAMNSTVLILSDGMGTGEAAHRESATVVALTGDLIEVGFELCEALECVNRLLIQKGADTDMYATLDAVLIDLFTGTARFVKYGAPPCFIIRGKKMHTISAQALPVGIVEEARPALHEANLRRGDTVVMMTDGVYDALGEVLEETVLRLAPVGTEDEAAEAILCCAAERELGDDMTVILARLE